MNKNVWYYRWGEWKLAASRQEDNMGKDNDDARAVGTSFYSIICLKDLNLDVSIIEILGQMSKEDYVHFLKDRMKIAVNLKKNDEEHPTKKTGNGRRKGAQNLRYASLQKSSTRLLSNDATIGGDPHCKSFTV